MGLGKTYISIAAAAALGFTRILVVCPPHLVGKWRREVKQTVQNAHALVAQKIADLEGVLKEKRPVLFVILSREKAKLGYFWKGHATRVRRGGFICPRCRTPLVDRDGIPVSEETLNRKNRNAGTAASPVGGGRKVVPGASPWPLISRTSARDISISSSRTSATNTKARPRPKGHRPGPFGKAASRFSPSPERFSRLQLEPFLSPFPGLPRLGRTSNSGTSEMDGAIWCP